MFAFERYRMGFDGWGLALFLVVMVPNLVWFAVPAGNDVLRAESITPVIDSIAVFFQIIMVSLLCLIKNTSFQNTDSARWMMCVIAALIFYYMGWGLYCAQVVNAATILILCIAPCLAFILYAAYKKNGVALISATLFMVCHLVYGSINFIF